MSKGRGFVITSGFILYKNKCGDYFITKKPYTKCDFKKELPEFEFVAIIAECTRF